MARTQLINRSYSRIFLRFALALIFIWFGALKLVGKSAIAPLVVAAYPFFANTAFFIALGMFEVLIGIFLLVSKFARFALMLLILHMLSTFAIFIIAPSLVFEPFPVLTLEGEFIVKNIVLIAAALLLLSSMRREKKLVVMG